MNIVTDGRTNGWNDIQKDIEYDENDYLGYLSQTHVNSIPSKLEYGRTDKVVTICSPLLGSIMKMVAGPSGQLLNVVFYHCHQQGKASL